MASQDSLVNFFKSIKCSNPFFPNSSGTVVSAHKDEKIPQVFQKLIQNRILAVPVVDNSGEVVSIFSMLDLVNHFVNEFSEEELKGLNSKKTSDFFFHYTELKEKKLEVLSERASQVLDKEMKQIETLDPVYIVEEGAEVFEAIKILVKTRAHRVVVHNHKENKLSGLITQSRLLEFVGTMLNIVPEAEKTIGELNLGFKEVTTVHQKEMAITAFKIMREKKISAVAVVDDEGSLVGNISANDLKLVGYDLGYFSYLSRPIREYLQWVNSVELQSPKSSVRSQMLLKLKSNEKELLALSCTKDNTLAYVIKTLNLYRVHRIYLIDEARRPIGIISIHDVLEEIFKSRM